MQKNKKIIILLSTASIFVMNAAFAALAGSNFDISTVTTTQQFLSGTAGDNTGIVQPTGAINVQATAAVTNAIDISNDGNSVNNYGTISNAGNLGSLAIITIALNSGSNNNLLNANGATISAYSTNIANAVSFNLFAAGFGNNNLNNAGLISSISTDSTGQSFANGLYLGGTFNNNFENSGTISAGNYNAAGILSIGDSNIFNNSGIITATDSAPLNYALPLPPKGNVYGAAAISMSGNLNQIINSGVLTANSTYQGASAVVLQGSNNTYTNTGLTAASSAGVNYNQAGTIIQFGAAAVDFTGTTAFPNSSYNTINYNTSGYMVGRIVYGAPNSTGGGVGNVLNIIDGGKDRNHFISYEGNATVMIDGNLTTLDPNLTPSPAANAGMLKAAVANAGAITCTPASIAAGIFCTQNNRAYLITINANGTANQISVIGRTGFTAANQMTKQITDSMSSTVHNRLSGLIDEKRNGHAHYYWTDAFGSYQERPKAKHVSETDSVVGGLLIGFDKNYNEKTVIGAYAGGTKGQLKARSSSNVTSTGVTIGNDVNNLINANGVVIGGYSSIKFANNVFVDLNVPVGYAQNKNRRTVYNNLAANGIEYNTGTYNEFYFRPAATLGKSIEFKHFNLVPSATISYLGQYLSGYTESGGASVIKVDRRYINTLAGITQVEFQKNLRENTNASFNVGVEASGRVGSKDVKVTALGMKAKFNPGGPKEYIDAIAGISVNHGLMKKGTNISANIFGAKGITNSSPHNFRVGVNATVEVKF